MSGLARGRDLEFERRRQLPANQGALVQDLELETLFDAMAGGDGFLFEVARSAVLLGARDGVETILYRQEILKDCLNNRATVREIYALALEAVARERKQYFGVFGNSPGTTLHRAVEVLQMFVEMLKRLRSIGRAESGKFASEGFVRFFAMLERELGDDYFATIEAQLKELKFRQGVLISAELGKGGVGRDYVLREPRERDRNWLAWLLAPRAPSYTLQIHPRDQAGGRALMELRDRGRQPRRQRARPVRRSYSELFPHAADRARLLSRRASTCREARADRRADRLSAAGRVRRAPVSRAPSCTMSVWR